MADPRMQLLSPSQDTFAQTYLLPSPDYPVGIYDTPLLNDLAGATIVPTEIVTTEDPHLTEDTLNISQLNPTFTRLYTTPRLRIDGFAFVYDTPVELRFPKQTNMSTTQAVLYQSVWVWTKKTWAAALPTTVTSVSRPITPKMGLQPTIHAEVATAALESHDYDLRSAAIYGNYASTRRVAGGLLPRPASHVEATRTIRHQQLLEFHRLAAAGQNYIKPLYVLFNRYLAACTIQETMHPGSMTTGSIFGSFTREAFVSPVQIAPLPQANLVYLSAYPYNNDAQQGNAGWVRTTTEYDGELALFDEVAATQVWEALDTGRAAFIDAVGLSAATLAELVWAMLPQTADQAPVFVPRDSDEQYTIDALTEQIPGVETVYVHWGTTNPVNTVPHRDLRGDAAAAAPRGTSAPWTPFRDLRPFKRGIDKLAILGAIRHLVTRHHANADAEIAWELAYSRFSKFNLETNPTIKQTATQQTQVGLVTGWGHRDLSLPYVRTAAAYFDFLYRPDPESTLLSDIFAAPPTIMLNSLNIHACKLSNALNWATFSTSITGDVLEAGRALQDITVVPTADTQPLLHHYAALATADQYELSPLTMLIRTALYLITGYTVSRQAAFYLPSAPLPLWRTHCAPYLSHPYTYLWLSKVIPIHQVLPTPTTLPLWPANTDAPIAPEGELISFSRVGRSLPLFKGYNWIQDGGMFYSIQHYMADVSADGIYAGDEEYVSVIRPVAWTTPFEHERPSAPYPVSTIRYPAEENGDWTSAFLIAGSVSSYNMRTNRVLALGVETTLGDLNFSRSSEITTTWRNLAEGIPRQSVTVSVKRPGSLMYASNWQNQYRVLSYIDAETRVPTMITSPSQQLELLPGDSLPVAEEGTVVRRLPAALANHSSPHVVVGNTPTQPITGARSGRNRPAARQYNRVINPVTREPVQRTDRGAIRPGQTRVAKVDAAPSRHRIATSPRGCTAATLSTREVATSSVSQQLAQASTSQRNTDKGKAPVVELDFEDRALVSQQELPTFASTPIVQTAQGELTVLSTTSPNIQIPTQEVSVSHQATSAAEVVRPVSPRRAPSPPGFRVTRRTAPPTDAHVPAQTSPERRVDNPPVAQVSTPQAGLPTTPVTHPVATPLPVAVHHPAVPQPRDVVHLPASHANDSRINEPQPVSRRAGSPSRVGPVGEGQHSALPREKGYTPQPKKQSWADIVEASEAEGVDPPPRPKRSTSPQQVVFPRGDAPRVGWRSGSGGEPIKVLRRGDNWVCFSAPPTIGMLRNSQHAKPLMDPETGVLRQTILVPNTLTKTLDIIWTAGTPSSAIDKEFKRVAAMHRNKPMMDLKFSDFFTEDGVPVTTTRRAYIQRAKSVSPGRRPNTACPVAQQERNVVLQSAQSLAGTSRGRAEIRGGSRRGSLSPKARRSPPLQPPVRPTARVIEPPASKVTPAVAAAVASQTIEVSDANAQLAGSRFDLLANYSESSGDKPPDLIVGSSSSASDRPISDVSEN